MPLNDVSKGYFDEALETAKACTYEPMAKMHFGCCMGFIAHALFAREIGHDEHRAILDEINQAMTENAKKYRQI